MAKVAKKVVKKSTKVSANTIKSTFTTLQETVSSMEDDVTKFADDAVAASGKRLRMASQVIRKMLGQYRKDIQLLIVQNKSK